MMERSKGVDSKKADADERDPSLATPTAGNTSCETNSIIA